jgi:hypothetical protein
MQFDISTSHGMMAYTSGALNLDQSFLKGRSPLSTAISRIYYSTIALNMMHPLRSHMVIQIGQHVSKRVAPSAEYVSYLRVAPSHTKQNSNQQTLLVLP